MSDISSEPRQFTQVEGMPGPAPDPNAETTAWARLRQATWEATQYGSYDEVRAYVEGVLREVESDEP